MSLCHCSFVCGRHSIFYVYLLRLIILDVTKREKARGDANCLSQIPSEKKNKTGISGIGSFVVACFQPATYVDRLQYYYYLTALIVSWFLCLCFKYKCSEVIQLESALAWAVSQHIGTRKNTKAWAVSQHIDTRKNTKSWAVSQHIGTRKNTKAWAVSQHIDTRKNTKSWAVSQHIDTRKNTKSWAVSQHIDTRKNTKAWAVSQHIDTRKNTKAWAVHNSSNFYHPEMEKMFHVSVHVEGL